MAINTLRARIVRPIMKMMAGVIIGLRRMAASTDLITIGFQLQAVRLMAVTAAHTTLVHFALHKRAIDINLILYLTISVI